MALKPFTPLRDSSLLSKVALAAGVMLTAMLLVITIFFKNTRREVKHLILENLRHAASEKASFVLLFLEMNKGRILDFSSDGFIVETLERYPKGENTGKILTDYMNMYKLPLLKTIYRLNIITASDGRVIASTMPGLAGRDVSGEEFFIKGRQRLHMIEMRGGVSGKAEIAVSAPIVSRRDGRLLGVITGFTDLSRFTEFFSGAFLERLGASREGIYTKWKTAETYLVNRNRLMLTESRFMKDAVLRQRVDTPPVEACIEGGRETVDTYVDYRGERVAGASACIRELGWTLLAEVDEREVFEPVRETQRYAAGTFAVVAAFAGAFFIFIVRTVIRQIKTLSAASARFAEGEYDVTVRPGGKDEIGVLSSAFNAMAEKVKRRTEALESTTMGLEAAEREARELNERLEDRVEERTEELKRLNGELQRANREIETFASYAAHDLRAPLRLIDGFSGLLLKKGMGRFDETMKENLMRIRSASARMNEIIDDLLDFSYILRADVTVETVDLSAMATEIARNLKTASPSREALFSIEEGLKAAGDARLLRMILENLLENAWKFTSKAAGTRIEFGSTGTEDGMRVYYVRDNGAGFDMAYAAKLFVPFQRLHSPDEYPGTGLGLATVQRIVERHGGRVWAQGERGKGAAFFFTLKSV